MRKVLQRQFFDRPVVTVAHDLLGKYIVRRIGRKEIAVQITEVEAYDGPHDKASHARFGLTPRSEVMFGHAAHWYVYLCYGIHEMLNIVTGPHDSASAVLIRGVEGASGPGRVTKVLKINRSFNTLPAVRKSGLWIEDRGVAIPKRRIKRTARIGVSYAGPVWAKKKYRFIIQQ
jgi:DNA-3-methyladenine glycosylase